ncbi:MAG: hypothetical protein RLZZ210_1406 [Pseudomonadota bacterium]|jgi:plasmid replication initiation protein
MIGSCHNYSINKTNFAIDISNNLTLLERKFFNHILFSIQEQGWNNKVYTISASSFSNLIGSKENRQNHNKIKSILRRLLTKELKILNAKYIGYEACTYISYIKLEDRNVIIELSEKLKEHLNINFVNEQGIKNISYGYTNLNLSLINQLNSTHSIAIYEFLAKIKNQNIDTIDINTLIEISSCKKCYKEFKRFNQSILKPALKEINQFTDLKISYELIKYANKVSKIKFITKLQDKNQIIIDRDFTDITPKKNSIDLPKDIEDIAKIGIKPASKLLGWFNEDKDRLLANWKEINTNYAGKSNAEKAKLMAYLWSIKANYISIEELEAKEQEKAKEAKKQAEIKKDAQLKEEQKKQSQEKSNNKLLETSNKYNKLSSKEKLEICTIIARNFSLKLNRCTEDDAYLEFDKLGNLYKHGISDYLTKNVNQS